MTEDSVYPKGYFFMIYDVGRASACGGFDSIKEAREFALEHCPNAEFIYKIRDNDRCTTMRKYKMTKEWIKKWRVFNEKLS